MLGHGVGRSETLQYLVFRVPEIEGGFRALQDIDDSLNDLRVLDPSGCVNESVAGGFLHRRMNNWLGVTNDREIRIVRHHYDLPMLLRVLDGGNQHCCDGLVVEVIFRLVDD